MGVTLPGAAEELDLAGCGGQQPFEDFDGRGFARAVRTEQPEAFAGANLEVESVDSAQGPVVFDQAATENGARVMHQGRECRGQRGRVTTAESLSSGVQIFPSLKFSCNNSSDM